MNDERIGRREYLRRHLAVAGAAALAGPGVLAACSRGEQALTCTDVSGLAPAEVQQRENAQYVDASPYPEKVCDNCNFWIPEQTAGQCGGCEVLKGPVHPKGYCTLWAAQAGGGTAS